MFPTGYASQEVKGIFENFNRATPSKKKPTTATIVVAVIVPNFILILCVLCCWYWRKRRRGTASPEERAQDQPPDGPDNSTSSTRWRIREYFQFNNTGGGIQFGHLVRVKYLYYTNNTLPG